MMKLYKLIAKTNFKSPIIIFPFLMPVIFMLLYSVFVPGPSVVGFNPTNLTPVYEGMTDTINSATNYINGIWLTMLAITIMQGGLMGFGFNFMNLKRSVLLRRVGATKMTKGEILGAFVLYGLTLLFINIAWSLILLVIINYSGLYYFIAQTAEQGYQIGDKVIVHIEWAAMFGGDKVAKIILVSLVGILISYGIGLLFVSISQNINKFQGLTSMYFFGTAILGGMMIPGVNSEWMQWVGLFLPHTYFSNLFDWATGAQSTVTIIPQETLNILNWTIPIVVGIAATGAATKLLKFD